MIKLRELTMADVPLMNVWRADRDIVDKLGGSFRHVNIETDEAWFEHYMRNRARDVRLGIVLEESGQLIGATYLLAIHPIDRTCEHGIMIGAKEHWSKGYGTLAQRLALRHAFADLNLHRVYAHIHAENDVSIRMHERNGFLREGVMREHVYKYGRYLDVIVMGVMAGAWLDRETARAGEPSQ